MNIFKILLFALSISLVHAEEEQNYTVLCSNGDAAKENFVTFVASTIWRSRGSSYCAEASLASVINTHCGETSCEPIQKEIPPPYHCTKDIRDAMVGFARTICGDDAEIDFRLSKQDD